MTKSWEEEGRETPSLTVDRVVVLDCTDQESVASVVEAGGSDFNDTTQTNKLCCVNLVTVTESWELDFVKTVAELANT